MKAKQLFLAATLAVTGVSAMAAEGEQWIPQTGQLTRAEVRAELARAQAAGELNVVGEAYGNVVAAKTNGAVQARSRDEVRAEATAKAHDLSINRLYVGG